MTDAKFITGLQQPVALALSDDDLFVANLGGSVGKYNAATGAAISPSFITGSHFQPSSLIWSDGKLFVLNAADDTIGEYDATIGKALQPNLITGLPKGTYFGLALWRNKSHAKAQRRKGKTKPGKQKFTTETRKTLRSEDRVLIKICSPFYLCGLASLREYISA